MKPDRTNYEIWLIDYLDGKLEPGQVEQLMTFLENNLDLKEEFNDLFHYNLKPPDSSFHQKKSLIKSVSEISQSQFEYLCIAASEKDLSDEQSAELEQLIGDSPEKRKTYDQFLKLKLYPPEVRYSKHNKLKKLTVAQRIIRLSAAGISAAATIAVMILLINIFNRNNADENSVAVLADSKDSLQIIAKSPVSSLNSLPVVNEAAPKSRVAISPILAKSDPDSIILINTEIAASGLSVVQPIARPELPLKIDSRLSVNLTEGSVPGILTAINIPQNKIPVTDENNANAGFIARTLRTKILKTEDQEKGRLKVYEIADAGIYGLNKLFGWNMSLKTNRNEKGEIKSFYFSSKLIRFNVPARKTQLMP